MEVIFHHLLWLTSRHKVWSEGVWKPVIRVLLEVFLVVIKHCCHHEEVTDRPDEHHLADVPPSSALMQHVVADGLHGGDPDATTDKHEELVAVTVDVQARSSVWPVEINIDRFRLLHVVVQPLGLVAKYANMQRDHVLVGGGGQAEWMPFKQRHTWYTYETVLTRFVAEIFLEERQANDI